MSEVFLVLDRRAERAAEGFGPGRAALRQGCRGLGPVGQQLDAVIELSVDEEVLVDRITGRFTCAKCGEGYHDRYKQPAVADTCDVCGSNEFKRRPDDNAETVRTRMAEYRAKTAPILPIYEARGIVSRVDGMADMDAVTEAIERIVAG